MRGGNLSVKYFTVFRAGYVCHTALCTSSTGFESYTDRLLQCYLIFALCYVVFSAVNSFCRVPLVRFLKL